MALSDVIQTVTDTQYRTRLSICEGCPFLSSLKICKICICVIPVKAKLKSQSCPKGYWK